MFLFCFFLSREGSNKGLTSEDVVTWDDDDCVGYSVQAFPFFGIFANVITNFFGIKPSGPILGAITILGAEDYLRIKSSASFCLYQSFGDEQRWITENGLKIQMSIGYNGKSGLWFIKITLL